MDFVDALKVLGRRWRVVAIGSLLMLAAAAAALWVVPTNYQATGQLVLLLPPQSTGAGAPTNPYLNLEPGLTVAGSLVASTLSTKEAERSLAEAGYTSEYSIGLDPNSGPVLEISTEDTDPDMAVGTRDEVMRRLQAELLRIQVEEDAPTRQLIAARPNSVASVAEALPGSKIRSLAVIGGLGVTLTLFIAFSVDRRRRTPSAGEVIAESPFAAPPWVSSQNGLSDPAVGRESSAGTPRRVGIPVPQADDDRETSAHRPDTSYPRERPNGATVNEREPVAAQHVG